MTVEITVGRFRCSECGTERDDPGAICPTCEKHLPTDGSLKVVIRR